MMVADTDILSDIPNAKPVRIFLPLKNMVERYRIQGVFQQSTPPLFNLYFRKGSLPVDAIDRDDTCIISIDMGGPTLSLEARITDINSDQHLTLRLVKSINHEQMREFFRVDAVTNVIGKSFQPQISGMEGEPWKRVGETIDISGSGILASFPENLPVDKQIRLFITLPMEEPEVIEVIAHPVRIMKLADDKYDVALHFDEISTEDRDKIIGCCLTIQRKLLRLKVKVKDL